MPKNNEVRSKNPSPKQPEKLPRQTSQEKILPSVKIPHHCDHTVEAIKTGFLHHIKYTMAKDCYSATDMDRYYALATTVRDRLIERWIQTSQTYYKHNVKRMYYLSMEYLIGRFMGTNVINLGMEKHVRQAMHELGLDWDNIRDFEVDAGLGNGGLGRLAACFLDSLATMALPGYGYGLRYDYGIFRQQIKDGYQIETPDNWLRHGFPWEIERPEHEFRVQFGGKVINDRNKDGSFTPKWIDYETVMGLPYDVPIAGYGNNTVNNLRLWTAKATEEFDLEFFNSGDYTRAYENKVLTENITKILYPNDNMEQGKELRFKQQYFFVCCSLLDIVRRFKVNNADFHNFADKVAIQLNDTHPALAVAELMRIFIDEEKLGWDLAWDLTVKTFGYTNHTLMPEALEKKPVKYFESLLPRHISIIYEINRHFLRQVLSMYPNDNDRVSRMSLIEEGNEKQVRMAYLSVVGSHAVNGVAKLHTELLKQNLLRDFYEMEPGKFQNHTNGITPRRFLLKSNPGLATLITERIGNQWVTNLDELKKLIPFSKDASFRTALRQVKKENKQRLALLIKQTTGIDVDPESLFDVQAKRLHEYKRQLLNVLNIVHQYFRIKDKHDLDIVPRTYIFGAKAAPGYAIAKLIIKLINDVAGVVNQDPVVNKKMKVVFIPDYRVTVAERLIPATDLSQQISTAGTEASGTGNMKFALNGALTIGTLDGANVEIRERVGADNFFLFGKTAEEVQQMRSSRSYNPWDYYNQDPRIKRVLDSFRSAFFNLEQPGLYQPLWDILLTSGDYYLHLADFDSYVATQERIDNVYRDQALWTRMCVLNIANMGYFSSDRTIGEYANDVWNLQPCHIASTAPAKTDYL